MSELEAKSDETAFIEILYNDCYGGYGVSKQALQMYNDRKLAIDPSWNIIEFDHYLSRSDPLLIQIYKEIGKEAFSERYASVEIQEIPKKYEKCFLIDEYDGKESVDIDYNYYKTIQIREILYSGKSNDVIVEELKKLV
jgi:hypothetical protein